MSNTTLQTIYRLMFTAREIDRVSREMTQRGEAFFHLSGAGHEASVALASHLTPDDWLHCHYRDKALLLARGISVRAFFDSMLCNEQSPSRGRRMSAFFADRERKVLSMVTPTGNNALQAVGVAAAVKAQASNPIVLCGIGDGTSQQGEVLEAIGEAARETLPVLFMIQDNRWAISTSTQGRTFYSLPDGEAESYCGIPIRRIDGRDVAGSLDAFGDLVTRMRQTRRPEVVIFQVERLDSHTNADDHKVYRSADDLRQSVECGDPIPRLEQHLIDLGESPEFFERVRREVCAEVAQAESAAASTAMPTTERGARSPVPVELTHASAEVRGDESEKAVTMGRAIREVLSDRLRNDERVFLCGQDIEDPKGDVFGVTRGLSTAYAGRVRNATLSESTIIGTAIGRSLAGQRPVAFVQFADFLPLAYNQLTSELANMYWRTDGDWKTPVLVMVACGAYRPGLGPYHAQTLDSAMAHTPGLDVFMPSTATDAAGMLQAAFRSERPTIFLYPKALLNDSARATSSDISKHLVPIGVARKIRTGRDISFVAWGNTVGLCERAAKDLERAGVESDIIDLRSLSPWDKDMVVASAEKSSRMIVVHEDNHTCGFAGEVLATVAEESRFPIAMRRVTRLDTFIPCNYLNQLEILPSYQRVLATAAELLGFDLNWEQQEQLDDDLFEIQAIGSAPSDETVTVVQFAVAPGTYVNRGEVVAEVEASKSVFEISSPVNGEVIELMAAEGDSIGVGRPLMRLKTSEAIVPDKVILQEQPGEPILVRRRPAERLRLPSRTAKHRPMDVGISTVHAVTGSRVVSNEEVLRSAADMTPDDVVRLTGIRSRRWADKGESLVDLAVRAANKTLEEESLSIDSLDLVICSTTSPSSATPSMACKVLGELVRGKAVTTLQAYDISAACSGYLYALQAGYDFLQSKPDSRVLVVTTEILSPLLDRDDLDTAILFGDAASATVLYGESYFDCSIGRLARPTLSAKGEDGSILSVPFRDRGFIKMQGRKVFSEAVRSMIASLNQACQYQGIGVNDLNMIVPHQANQRILDAIQNRVDPTVYSNICRYGNTSSSSIPLCLSEVLKDSKRGERMGLCAFGGGFTFGASILETV